MTRVYLIRHAEAAANVQRIAQGHTDGGLTEKGLLQIEALRRRFADIPVDAVYSSDLLRARTTAEAIYVPKGLPLHTDSAYREICLGRWENRPWQELYDNEAEQMDAFNHHPERWHVEGSETPWQVIERFSQALRQAVLTHDGGTVAVFSHGCALRIMLAALQGLGVEAVGASGHADNTAVSLLEWEGDDVRLIYRDDNRHVLEAGLSTLATQDWWKE